MKVAVIGAAGKMGSWFTHYFVNRGYDVSVFDVKPFSVQGANNTSDLYECVNEADLALISVPVQRTVTLIRQCAKEMKSSSCIAEISSVKSNVLPALKKVREDLSVLCVHPMFGPGADSTTNLKMLFIPVRNKANEQNTVRRLFSGISIITMPDARTHDRCMAAVLGLTYFVNIAFAQVMSKEDLARLKQVGGTTFSVQSMLAESVMTDEPDLAAALLSNPYTKTYMTRYLNNAQNLVQTKKLVPLLGKIKRDLQSKQDLQASYRRLYRALRDGNIT